MFFCIDVIFHLCIYHDAGFVNLYKLKEDPEGHCESGIIQR